MNEQRIIFKLTTPTKAQTLLTLLPINEGTKRETLPPQVVTAMTQFPLAETLDLHFIDEGTPKSWIVAKIKHGASGRDREELGALFAKRIEALGISEVSLDLGYIGKEGLEIALGIALASYRFEKHKSKNRVRASGLKQLTLISQNPELLRAEFLRLEAVVEGIYYARDLTSSPPNILYPSAYAQELEMLKELGVQVEILNEKDLAKAGMNALLAVGQGSSRESAVAILTWKGDDSPSPTIALVGKGVCFDSGGVCLKKPADQYEMKWDKAGAGVVAGVIKALAISKVPVHVVGILGLVENMPDGNAIKPGDVILTRSGKTVEIANTDAEGRLVLADCLWYAQKRYNPKKIVDLGTLTIETFATLGTAYAGLYCNTPSMAEGLKLSGDRTGELLWELPMGPYFAKQIESSVADIKNIGVDLWGENGAAAEFLRCFIEEGREWAHLDIAGVSWSIEDLPLCKKGVTGFGVKLLYDWVSN